MGTWLRRGIFDTRRKEKYKTAQKAAEMPLFLVVISAGKSKKAERLCCASRLWLSERANVNPLEKPISKPSYGRSSTPSAVRPSACCSRHNGDRCHSARNIRGHRGRDKLGGRRGLHLDPDRPGSCCSRDLGRDPCPYLDPCLGRDLCHGRETPHPVEQLEPMPKPNRR